MCTFVMAEPVQRVDSTEFAACVMKLVLCLDLCHTLVINKDSKFLGVFKDVCNLLHMNCHVLSGGNHDPMIVERINRYLSRGLKVLANERGTIHVATEAILLLIYPWNLAPIPGTDISRSLVAVGPQFSFPIDFSAAKHLKLMSSPANAVSFSRDQATLLTASREIGKVLLDEH